MIVGDERDIVLRRGRPRGREFGSFADGSDRSIERWPPRRGSAANLLGERRSDAGLALLVRRSRDGICIGYPYPLGFGSIG
jgi:hypothetical protein